LSRRSAIPLSGDWLCSSGGDVSVCLGRGVWGSITDASGRPGWSWPPNGAARPPNRPPVSNGL
jgi:hypothetical protein